LLTRGVSAIRVGGVEDWGAFGVRCWWRRLIAFDVICLTLSLSYKIVTWYKFKSYEHVWFEQWPKSRIIAPILMKVFEVPWKLFQLAF
jgi:hypothetical protein